MTTAADRERAAQWARDLLARADLIVLDTETTGLGPTDQVIQVGIVDRDGAVLLDTLVKATCRISLGAYAIHGITEVMLADASSFAALAPRLAELLTGRRLAIYNADFDIRLLRQSAAAAGVALPVLTADCVMRAYSQWVGEWSGRRGGYRWQVLPGGDHSAAGDARATLAVLRRMAGD